MCDHFFNLFTFFRADLIQSEVNCKLSTAFDWIKSARKNVNKLKVVTHLGALLQGVIWQGIFLVVNFGSGIWGNVGRLRDFFGSWVLPPFHHPPHLKTGDPPPPLLGVHAWWIVSSVSGKFSNVYRLQSEWGGNFLLKCCCRYRSTRLNADFHRLVTFYVHLRAWKNLVTMYERLASTCRQVVHTLSLNLTHVSTRKKIQDSDNPPLS